MKKVVAIFGKQITEGFFPFFEKLLLAFKEKGVILIGEEKFCAFLSEKYTCHDLFESHFNEDNLVSKNPNVFLSIGGDGTFLDSVSYVKDSGIPILGMNTGRLGFLASMSVWHIEKAVDDIYNGNYEIEKRDLIKVEIKNHSSLNYCYGLNEITVQKTEASTLINIHAYINGAFLTTYWADGLIIATPTGSTAYSLSGGGPIVSPDCKSMILTPLSPHTLTMRPLVIPLESKIELHMESRAGYYMLTWDSKMKKMEDKIILEISKADFTLSAIKLPDHNFYKTLREKLGWGEDIRNDKNFS